MLCEKEKAVPLLTERRHFAFQLLRRRRNRLRRGHTRRRHRAHHADERAERGPAWAFHQLPEKFAPDRDAAADVEQALGLARAQRKLVFVDVGGEWCSWCHVFDGFVASHAQVRNLLNERYVLVKVNYSPQQPNVKLLSRFPKAKGYPHFYILDATGKVLASQGSAELEAGNDYDETKALAFLSRYQPA